MKVLDHWHPVLKSKDLKSKPVKIEIAGNQIVLFRDKNNNISAVKTRCPHRGMDLSFGEIKDDTIVCPYHGWSFDGKGTGKSPCNKNMKINIESFETRESHDYIWLTKVDSKAKFPEIDIDGYQKIVTFHKRADAPIEPVLDNFHEFEHFPKTHKSIGYDFKQIIESEILINFFPDRMKLEFYPEQELYPMVRKIFRLPDGSKYFMNIDVNFSPMYSVYRQGWLNPTNGEKHPILINVVFFVPVNNNQTDIVMFLLTKKDRLSFIKNAFIRKMSEGVIDDDLKILNNLADKYMDVKEMKLSRHDKAIIEIRKRINSIYFDNSVTAKTGEYYLKQNEIVKGAELPD